MARMLVSGNDFWVECLREDCDESSVDIAVHVIGLAVVLPFDFGGLHWHLTRIHRWNIRDAADCVVDNG